MSTVAFVGLGNMGGPMAATLVRAGTTVHGYDPGPDAAHAARSNGVVVFTSAREAARDVDVVITMLPNGAAVRSTYGELLAEPLAASVFIDCSTISVDDARYVHRLAADAGKTQADAPVSGGIIKARNGTLTFMVGASNSDLNGIGSILEPMADRVVHCGGPGSGQAAKICNNMVLGVQQIAVGEAFALADELGLSGQALYDVIIGATGNCWAVHTNCPVPGPVPASPANHGFAPGFSTALMNKDMQLALAAASSVGVRTPVSEAAALLYQEFSISNSHKDFSAIIENSWPRKGSGILGESTS